MSQDLQPPDADEISERWTRALADYGDPMWDEVCSALFKSSCAYVAGELLTGPPEEPYKGQFLIEPHHIEWDRIVTTYDRFCVEAPRGHGKSMFFALAYPVWKIITDPKGLGYIFSQTSDQAVRILDDLKREIENNPKLQYLYPTHVGRRWSSTQIELSNGHRVMARGYGSRVRGGHPGWIMNDDVVGDDAAYSNAVREKQVNYFYTAITNMILPTGQIGVVGTPQHNMDLYGDLERNKSYKFQRFPALSNGQALWPKHFSPAKLEKIKEEIGTVRFAREYNCVPVADDMSLFPKALFFGDPVEQKAVTLGLPVEYWHSVGVNRIYVGVDFAMSSNVSADYTVIWIMGTDVHKNRWIIDIIRARGMPYQEQLSLINTYGHKYQATLMYLESNQMQRIFSAEMQRQTDLPIKAYQTGVEKHALDIGVPSLRILLENKKYRIPRGDKNSVDKTDAWIEEMHNFTFHNGKVQSVGGHDDLPMANWLCELAVRAGGFSFSFGEDMSDEAIAAYSDDNPYVANDGGQILPFGPRVAGNQQTQHNEPQKMTYPDDATRILRRGY